MAHRQLMVLLCAFPAAVGIDVEVCLVAARAGVTEEATISMTH
jgi:hypothetical protein